MKLMEDLCDENIALEKKIALLENAKISPQFLADCAHYLLARALPLDLPNAIDVCGTGGSKAAKTFNVSTASAFVLAAGNVKVVKHGNRAVSSTTGSSDVLAALGVAICETEEAARKCFTWNNLCFVAAPAFHFSLKNVALARKMLKKPSFFNILGPLCNPARVKRQVIGVYNSDYHEIILETARILGKTDVICATGEDGLDEVSLFAPTALTRLQGGEITQTRFTPEKIWPRLNGGTAEENAATILSIFRGEETGAGLELVCVNAAAGFLVAGETQTMEEGIARAREIIASGAALKKLEDLRV